MNNINNNSFISFDNNLNINQKKFLPNYDYEPLKNIISYTNIDLYIKTFSNLTELTKQIKYFQNFQFIKQKQYEQSQNKLNKILSKLKKKNIEPKKIKKSSSFTINNNYKNDNKNNSSRISSNSLNTINKTIENSNVYLKEHLLNINELKNENLKKIKNEKENIDLYFTQEKKILLKIIIVL